MFTTTQWIIDVKKRVRRTDCKVKMKDKYLPELLLLLGRSCEGWMLILPDYLYFWGYSGSCSVRIQLQANRFCWEWEGREPTLGRGESQKRAQFTM